MRWEVLIEILLHITPDINTDTGGRAAQCGIPSQHQENTQSGVRPCLVMNECDNMRAALATWASSLLTSQPSAGLDLVTRARHHLSNSILMDFLYSTTITSYKPAEQDILPLPPFFN